MKPPKKVIDELYLEEIRAARRMSGEEKLLLAIQLSDWACDNTRAGIRDEFPDATSEEVERMLRQRCDLARRLENQL